MGEMADYQREMEETAGIHPLKDDIPEYEEVKKPKYFMFVFEHLLPIKGWKVHRRLDRYSPYAIDGKRRVYRWVVVTKKCSM